MIMNVTDEIFIHNNQKLVVQIIDCQVELFPYVVSIIIASQAFL